MSKKHKRQSFSRPSIAPTAKANEFNPDYSTTKRELRRIGLLAGTFIAILVALSFFQDQLLALFVK